MPSTISIPTDGRIGPGLAVQVATDFTGPLPVGTLLEIELLAAGTEVSMMLDHFVVNSPTVNVVLGDYTQGQILQAPGRLLEDGAALTTVIRWFESPGVLLDTSTRTDLHWDPTSGLFAALGHVAATVPPPTVLVPQLDRIEAAVRRELADQLA